MSGQTLGVTDVGPEVVALISHATQECLRGLLEKLTEMAEHRKSGLKVSQYDSAPTVLSYCFIRTFIQVLCLVSLFMN